MFEVKPNVELVEDIEEAIFKKYTSYESDCAFSTNPNTASGQ